MAASSVGVALAVVATAWVAVLVAPDSQPTPDIAGDPTPTYTQGSLQKPGNVVGHAQTEGTWRLTALVGDDGQSVLPPDSPSIIIAIKEGEISGATGCGRFRGSTEFYTEVDRTIEFADPSVDPSGEGCAAARLVVERLAAVRYFNRADDSTLTLHAENWMILVELRRIPG